jgi:hypothetical protein
MQLAAASLAIAGCGPDPRPGTFEGTVSAYDFDEAEGWVRTSSSPGIATVSTDSDGLHMVLFDDLGCGIIQMIEQDSTSFGLEPRTCDGGEQLHDGVALYNSESYSSLLVSYSLSHPEGDEMIVCFLGARPGDEVRGSCM